MSALPPITLTEHDLARLEALLETPAIAALPAARLLADELARATVVPAAELPADVVTMDSTVTAVDDVSGQEYRLRLCWPADADPAKGRISVLAPVGSALLGLSVGQAIDWTGPAGKPLRVRVTGVEWQPEAQGEQPPR